MGVHWCIGPIDNSLIEFWEELTRIGGWWSLPWYIGGDFNVIWFSFKQPRACHFSSIVLVRN